MPPPPAHLEPATKVWWVQILTDFPIEQHQLQTLQAAGESWDRSQQAREALAKHGLTYVDGKGMVRARPEVAIERDSRISYLRCMRELEFDNVEPPVTGSMPWADLD
ncbi:hypothetical protein XH99_01070 [Bradyrhizobium nanningense]|uniref:Uncharacterized protein n=1 Tax=Bradyrhizobium nanningense TaxID=1325118 RepID=A0A4Q0SL26_9BRAD|nr:hypothetical protein XH84_07030 [Bradyrhizobium nanningense]RXH38456.1 hypothetical protein XH99_01070 [Bradyrhizobium nanningense]